MTVNLVSLDPRGRSAPSSSEGRLDRERSSPRRSTLAEVEVLEGPELEGQRVVTDLSADGAFLRTTTRLHQGERLRLSLRIPTDKRPIPLTARVVRSSPTGLGVRFEELSARDRSRLRSHAGYYEMDDAIVRLQQRLGDLIPGNLLPLGEVAEIEAILDSAVRRHLRATVLLPGRGFSPVDYTLAGITLPGPEERDSFDATLRLEGPELASSTESRVVHLAFSDGTLHYALEGIVLEHGERPLLLLPNRIYATERRTGARSQSTQAWCRFEAPFAEAGAIRLPVLDLGRGGASIQLPAGTPLLPATHLPAFVLETDEGPQPISGATVRYVSRLNGDSLRAGLHFDHAGAARETFQEVQEYSLRSSIATRLRQAVSHLRGRVRTLVAGSGSEVEQGVEVVRCRNRLGNTVVGIVDANFDTSDPDLRPDVAVVIAPAVLKRKEVFGLLARTLIDDLGRDGHKVATLRFDACHVVGESTMDQELVREGRPYLNWDLSQLAADMEASLQYLRRRFRPVRSVLVSISLSAIPARKVVRSKGAVDLWIAPFGCPDAQDMLRNYLAGLELFEDYMKGGGPEIIHIHGRPIRGRHFYLNAVENGLAFLDQAREDLSRIEIPVTWILGTYDHWVTRSRVRAMLEAPGGGVREVFECATGHVLKEGPEAIEIFKLVSESISKHVFGADRPARDPDFARFAQQSRGEWARVERSTVVDTEAFWREHLFGPAGDDVGYDVMLDHPEYPRFLRQQAELLDPQPGERIADFGCGTGNLLRAMIESYPPGTRPGAVTFIDIVPEAIERTKEKFLEYYRERSEAPPPHQKLVSDLEVSRLCSIRDFLSGQVYGVEGLVGRLEGLSEQAAHKISAAYGKEVHEILRGRETTRERLRQLCPALEEDEIEVLLEISRASRFVLGRTLAADLVAGGEAGQSTADLRFRKLRFGASRRDFLLPLNDSSIDRIGCSLVISYLADPIVCLREIHRVLKPRGTVVVSSIRPNFDPSKLYTEEVEILAQRLEKGDTLAQRKLVSLRHFANMLSRLIELEEDGRFRFFSGGELRTLAEEAGFSRINVFRGLGNPPTAVIVRAEKRP